jgi:hypothetical protein
MEEKPTKCSAGHAWLAGIIINLLPYSGSYDLALRDFTLLVAALATTQLGRVYDAPWHRGGAWR